jgi:hypothetical protein
VAVLIQFTKLVSRHAFERRAFTSILAAWNLNDRWLGKSK